jgi:hypothetical protein
MLTLPRDFADPTSAALGSHDCLQLPFVARDSTATIGHIRWIVLRMRLATAQVALVNQDEDVERGGRVVIPQLNVRETPSRFGLFLSYRFTVSVLHSGDT